MIIAYDSFEDIINLPHHVSDRHHQMTMHDRAAQFSPFAALTGFDEEIDETARLTDAFRNMTEDMSAELNAAFQRMTESENSEVTVTYFKPDARKDGGSYETYRGVFRFFEAGTGLVKFTDGMTIDADMICRIKFSD